VAELLPPPAEVNPQVRRATSVSAAALTIALAALVVAVVALVLGTKSEEAAPAPAATVTVTETAAATEAAEPECVPSDPTDPVPANLPPNANALATGIVVNPDAPADHVLAIYTDPQCPYCAQAEELSGEAVAEAVAGGKVRVEYRTMKFLDYVNSAGATAQSSTRAANAAACADGGGFFFDYYTYLLAHQPTEGVGYTDDYLMTELPTAIGVEGDKLTAFQQCYTNRDYADFVDYVANAAPLACVTGTPTYRLDGVDVVWYDAATLQAQLDAVA
jgi:protein-disulfide isomerase